MLKDALSWFTKVKLEAGYVVVLETAGRSGHWNPHLHILMTSGGVTPQQQWREVDYFPFTVLHKKWQYHLFTMLKQRVGTRAMKAKIDALWRTYPRGLVAYLEEGKVPAGGEGLAYYLSPSDQRACYPRGHLLHPRSHGVASCLTHAGAG